MDTYNPGWRSSSTTEEQWWWIVHLCLFNDGLNPLDIIRGCWALRQSHCFFSSLHHFHPPGAVAPSNIKLQRPHPRIHHTGPLKSLHHSLIFSTSFMLCSVKPDHLPNRPNAAPGLHFLERFYFSSFSFYLFTAVVLNPHQVSNSGPKFAPSDVLRMFTIVLKREESFINSHLKISGWTECGAISAANYRKYNIQTNNLYFSQPRSIERVWD